MTEATPEQLAMARRIAEGVVPDGLDPNLSLRLALRAIAEQAALAAIVETTEAAAKMVDNERKRITALYTDNIGMSDMRVACEFKLESIVAALRSFEHLSEK